MPHVPAVRCPALMAVLVLILFATPLAAQSGHNLERPDHWKARYDDGTSAPERRFVVMRPGWHVFSGPGGLFWDPGSFASGAFAVSSTIFLFPEGDPDQSGSTRLDSPFGLFSPAATWTVTLRVTSPSSCATIATSGSPSTAAARPAISCPGPRTTRWFALGAESSGPVNNVLAVDVRGDHAMFYLNDAPIAELPRNQITLDGVIGVRAGAGLSIHVTEVDIGPNRRAE